jgi:hypothetical protein
MHIQKYPLLNATYECNLTSKSCGKLKSLRRLPTRRFYDKVGNKLNPPNVAYEDKGIKLQNQSHSELFYLPLKGDTFGLTGEESCKACFCSFFMDH